MCRLPKIPLVFGLAAVTACLTWTTRVSATQTLVADISGNHVLKYEVTKGTWTALGELIPPGSYGGAPFLEPLGMATHGYHLFIATREGIFLFDIDGNFQKIVAKRHKHYLGVADSLAVDSKGNLYFSTPWGDAIQRIYKITNPVDGPEIVALVASDLNTPRGLTIGHNGHLFVADRGSNSIKEFSVDGKLIGDFKTQIEKPQALLWDAANARYLVSYGPIGSQSIGEITTEGFLQPLYKNPGGPKRSRFANTTTLQVVDGYIYGGNFEFKQLDRVDGKESGATILSNVTIGSLLLLPTVKQP